MAFIFGFLNIFLFLNIFFFVLLFFFSKLQNFLNSLVIFSINGLDFFINRIVSIISFDFLYLFGANFLQNLGSVITINKISVRFKKSFLNIISSSRNLLKPLRIIIKLNLVKRLDFFQFFLVKSSIS